MWGAFSNYHYLTETIPNNGKVYVGFINYEPVACVVMSRFPHPINKDLVKASRVVTLPHWQGFGIGMKMLETIIKFNYQHRDVRITTTLPIIQDYLWRNDKTWFLRYQGKDKKGTAGPNAKFAGDVREVFMETYQFNNKFGEYGKISRKNCPPDKKRVYPK